MACNVLFSLLHCESSDPECAGYPWLNRTHKCLPADPALGIPAKDNPPDKYTAADYLDRLFSFN